MQRDHKADLIRWPWSPSQVGPQRLGAAWPEWHWTSRFPHHHDALKIQNFKQLLLLGPSSRIRLNADESDEQQKNLERDSFTIKKIR